MLKNQCFAPDPTIALETASSQPVLAKYARILLGSGDRVACAESQEEGLDQQHLPRRSSQDSLVGGSHVGPHLSAECFLRLSST